MPTHGLLHATSRLAQVTTVLARHGFAGVLRGEDRWPDPVQVREAFEELGIVFCKLGQVLSTRRDLLPKRYTDELERLQDKISPEPSDTVREIVWDELGQPVEKIFADFDDAPLASATIAQVHGAHLPDGRSVVVKVQRPNLAQRISEDLAILAYLASAIDTLMPTIRALDLPAIVREFHDGLLRELDFRREARNVQRFRANLADEPTIWIPDVIADCSSGKIITFERSPGMEIRSYIKKHEDAGPILAQRLAAVFLRQVFAEGLFHADPHPGNFFVLDDGRFCLHDFGVIGEIEPSMRDSLAELLAGFARSDTRAVVQSYFDLGLVGPDIDREAVERAVAELVREVRDSELNEISIGDALTALLRLGSRHRIRNPGVMLLLARAFLTLEAVMRSLDPELDVLAALQQAVPNVAKRRFSTERLAADAADMAHQLDRFLREAPADLRRTLRRVADGKLGEVQVRDHPSMARDRWYALGLVLRTVAAGFLAVTGALLLQERGWRLVVGIALLVSGLGGMAVTALKRTFHRDP